MRKLILILVSSIFCFTSCGMMPATNEYEPIEIEEIVETVEVETEVETSPIIIIIESNNTDEKSEEIVEQIPENCYTSVFESMTEEEYNLFTVILYLESDCQDAQGKIMTAEVILNRVLAPIWPNTMYEVLSQRGQFSTWKNHAKVIEGQAYKAYGDGCVDLTPEREAIEFLRVNGRTYLDYNYLFFDSLGGVNGRDHVYYDGHAYGRGKWE